MVLGDMSVMLDDAPRCDTPDPDEECGGCGRTTLVWVIEGELRAKVCLTCDQAEED